MRIITHVSRWLQQRPGRLAYGPPAAAGLAGAAATLLFQVVLAAAGGASVAWAQVGFAGLLAAVVAGLAMRLYRELMGHLVAQSEERLRLSDQLAQERLLMRALMDHSPDHIYFKDRESRFVRINRSHAASFGFADPSEAVGKTDFDLFGPEHARQAFADEQAILRTGQPLLNQVEKETWPDGRVTWASSSKLPLRDARGQVIGTFGISRDVTEQVNRDLRIRQLSLAVEQSPDVVVVTDLDGRITYVNPRFTEVTGYGPQEAVGQNPRLLKSGRTPPSVYAELWTALAAGRVWSGEMINRRKNGELYWSRLLVAPLRDEQGQVVQFVAVGEDVTARKEAEAARQATLDGLRAVLEMADELIAAPDLEAVYRRAVELARDRLALDRVSLVLLHDGVAHGTFGTNLRGETTDERSHRHVLPAAWLEPFAARDPRAARWQVQSGPLYEWNGQAMTVVGQGPVVATPVQGPDGLLGVLYNDSARRGGEPDPVRQEVVAVFASLLGNVLARKQAEDRQRAVEARQRDWMERTDRLNSLGLLAAGMAHEINNPLQGMLSHLRAAAQQAPPDFAGRASLQMVERGIDTIAGLVRKLLVLGAAGERGQEQAECRAGVEFVLHLLASQLSRTQVAVVRELADEPLVVGLAQRELSQVLLNLVINARDAMPQGGTLTLAARRVGNEVEIEVRDTGQGIAPEHLRQLFTPFFTTKGGRGTGLGLSVADALVRGAGGRIEVESTPGQGSRFRLWLPRAGG